MMELWNNALIVGAAACLGWRAMDKVIEALSQRVSAAHWNKPR